MVLGLSLALVILVLGGFTDQPDRALYDAAVRARSTPSPSNILIVAIDDESLSSLGAYPWRRSTQAAVLRRLAAARPKAVIEDILFVSPTSSDEDRGLGEALRAVPNAITPLFVASPGPDDKGYWVALPISAVRSASTVGQGEILPDSDGVVRRLPLALDGTERWLALAAIAAGAEPRVAARTAKLPAFQPYPPDTPPREIAPTLIRFEAKGRIPTVSVSRLLHGDVPTDLIEGRYVLVGSTAAGLGDRFATPLGRDHPLSGVEIEANLLDTLLRGPGLREADVVLRLAVGLALLWLTMLGLARLPPRAGRVLWTAAIGAPLALCASLFFLANLWLAPTAPTLVVALALPIWSWRRERQTNALVVEALSNLAADPDLTAAHGNPARFVDDKAADQLRLVQETVARVRGLRRLVNAAVRSLPDATVLIALTGEIVLANQEALRLFRARSDVTREDIEGFFAASRPPPFTPDALGRPDGGWAGERPGADGSLRDIRYVPWTDESGETLGWVVRFADITALRRAEIAREEALQLLTHDMRSPQASIIALVSRWEEAPPERLRERIAHYARRTIALADGFLQLARADAGGYEMAPIDLRDVLTEAADDLWALSTAKTIAIRQKPSTAECLVLGNHSLLMRAFANLLDNAVKFSEPGSRIECEVLREERASGPVVIATIADQGVGIPREALDRLFRRFSPHRQPRQHGVSGVGLGLAFVESVVQGHGGRIACRSAVGVGTTFDLEFPALPGPRRGPTGSGRVHGEQADEQKT